MIHEDERRWWWWCTHIFPIVLYSGWYCLVWCCACCAVIRFDYFFFLLPRNVAVQIKRMHGLSFCVQCAWVRSLSFLRFNELIICLIQVLIFVFYPLFIWHSSLLRLLSLRPQPIWSEFYSFYSFRPSFAIPQGYRKMVGFWLKYEKYTALQIHQTIAETNRNEHTHTQNEQIIIIERNGFK